MDKQFWGPAVWCMIHVSSAGYTPTKKTSFNQFINSLPQLLPCQYCREHLTQNLEQVPLSHSVMNNNVSLFNWSYRLHDTVNKQLNELLKSKRQTPTHYSPDYELVFKYYISNIHNYKTWGKCFWRMVHSFAASYRPYPHVKKAFKDFVCSLKGIIPSDQFNISLAVTDADLVDAHTLFLWSFNEHNKYNAMRGKSSPPFEGIKSQYFNEQVCNSCGL